MAKRLSLADYRAIKGSKPAKGSKRSRRSISLDPSEREISRAVGEFLQARGKVALRLNSGSVQTISGSFIKLCDRGTPDRVLFDGLTIFLEVKTRTGSLSVDQVNQQAKLRGSGSVVATVRSSIDAEKILELLDRFEPELATVRSIADRIQAEIERLGLTE